MDTQYSARAIALAWLLIIVVMLVISTCESKQSDIDCLRSIKESLQDPLNKLSSWRFKMNPASTDVFFCSFIGVDCWGTNTTESLVSSIKLNNMGLIGQFPHGIANCSGLSNLDLSNNHLKGSIPWEIWSLIPFVTFLDLSSNEFSGEIPNDIAKCPYLNVLRLDSNRLMGSIPEQLVGLRRLRNFTVANNRLSGQIPGFTYSTFPIESYVNNTGLCGYPLEPCNESSGEDVDKAPFIGGFFVGWAIFCGLFTVVGLCTPVDKYTIKFIKRLRMMTTTTPRVPRLLPSNDGDDTIMIMRLEKFASRMSFLELRKATDNFNENYVLSIGETGIMYKATLSNGWRLAIKRLFKSPHLDRQFESEIMTLGRLRHKNLVPLIGFCRESNERFLIYKFMPTGNLHDCIFSSAKIMEWPLRAKIAVGIAKGILWLHENRVVHRGISSKCVLLDENFVPKISDFGKATTPNDTCWSNWNNGSLNKEFQVPGSYEEDVYGFGMVLLELITMKKYEELFVSSFEGVDGDMFEQISQKLLNEPHEDEMFRFLRIAGKCVECDPGNWPSMVQVYQMLVGTRRVELVVDDSDTKNEIQFAN